MKFNKLVCKILSENNNSKIKKVKNSAQNTFFSDPPSPAAHSGFKGDTLNPATKTLIFKAPRVKKKSR
jgi:hypothetical protein